MLSWLQSREIRSSPSSAFLSFRYRSSRWACFTSRSKPDVRFSFREFDGFSFSWSHSAKHGLGTSEWPWRSQDSRLCPGIRPSGPFPPSVHRTVMTRPSSSRVTKEQGSSWCCDTGQLKSGPLTLIGTLGTRSNKNGIPPSEKREREREREREK